MKVNKKIYAILVACAISCSQTVSPSEYLAWVTNENNQLKQIKKIDGVFTEIQYKPISYLILSKRINNIPTQQEHDSIAHKHKSTQEFSLRISLPNQSNQTLKTFRISNESDFVKREQFMLFGMQQQLKLVDGTDTLPCILFHAEQNANLAPYALWTFAFERRTKTDKQAKTLIFNAQEFGIGILKFHFDQKTLQNIPSIKLN